MTYYDIRSRRQLAEKQTSMQERKQREKMLCGTPRQEIYCEEHAYMDVDIDSHLGIRLVCTQCRETFREIPPPPDDHSIALAEEFTRRVDAGECMHKVFFETMARKVSWHAPDKCMGCRVLHFYGVIGPTLQMSPPLAPTATGPVQLDVPVPELTREWCVSAILGTRGWRGRARGCE